MAKKETKNKKRFFKDFKAELKKVIWPTPKQLLNNTIAVVVIVLLTAAIVFILDTCFNFINSKGINGLKSKIRSTSVVQNAENNTIEESNEEEPSLEGQEEAFESQQEEPEE